MSRDELVGAYLDGQISRRVFIRRLLGFGVSVAAAMSYANVLTPKRASAAGGGSSSYPEVIVSNFAFTPPNVNLNSTENGVLWTFEAKHSATDSSGMQYFDSNIRAAGEQFAFKFPIAGRYKYECKHPVERHVAMRGHVQRRVRVIPESGDEGSTFNVRWGITPSTPPGFVADVQIKRPTQSGFVFWKTAQTDTNDPFVPDGGPGTYRFRARLRKPGEGSSRYCEPTNINVV